MQLQLIEKPTFEAREECIIAIFPSRPYWFSATKEIKDILDILSETINEEEVMKIITSRFNIASKKAAGIFSEIRDLLFSNGVLSIDGKVSEQTGQVEPDFQINAVEEVLVIAVTRNCNLHCPHCYSMAGKVMANEMKLSDLKKLIDNLANMSWESNVSCVGLTGGELFMRNDSFDLIDYICSKGFKVLISSNGVLLTEEAICKLAAYQNLKISISLDGSVPKIHESIRGEGTFSTTIDNIRKLAKSGIPVGVGMFIHQDNFDYLRETIQLAEDLRADAFNCFNLMKVGRANAKNGKQFLRVPEHLLYRELFSVLRDNANYQKMMWNSTFANQVMGVAGGVKSYYCGIGTNRALYVRADGNIYPCPDTALPEFCLGNIKRESLGDIWENSQILQKLRLLNVDNMNQTCSSCDVRYFCGGGCRGENYQVTKKLLSPHFNCDEFRKSIIEIMWMLTEEPTFFQGKVQNLHQKACL